MKEIFQSDLEKLLAHSWVNAISVATTYVNLLFTLPGVS